LPHCKKYTENPEIKRLLSLVETRTPNSIAVAGDRGTNSYWLEFVKLLSTMGKKKTSKASELQQTKSVPSAK